MTNPFGAPGENQGSEQSNSQYSPYGQQPGYQQGAYQQPGYQQPGYQQPGYPQPGYQQGANQQQPAFDAMTSLGQGWKIFSENPMPWIVGALVWGGIAIVIFFLGYIPMIISAAQSSNSVNPEFPMGSFFLFMLLALVAGIIGLVGSAVMSKAAVKAVAGHPIAVSDFFNFANIGKIIVVGLLLQIGIQIGSFLIVGGIVVGFLFYFAVAASAARPAASITDAFKLSFDITTKNVVQVILLYILVSVVSMVGAMVLLIGLLAAMPVVTLANMHAFQTATGGEVRNRA